MKVRRAVVGVHCEQVAGVVDLLPPRPSSYVRKPVSARNFQVGVIIFFQKIFFSITKLTLLRCQGGDVSTWTCLPGQSEGQQKCHGVRKIEIKGCVFNIIYTFSRHLF